MTTEIVRRLSLSGPQYRWFVVFLLWVSHAIYFLNYNSLGVLGPFVKKEFALNNTQFGLLFTSIFIGITAVQIPAGIGCDRIGARKVMSLGLLMIGFPVLLFSLTRTLLFSYVSLLFLGFGTGCCQMSAVRSVIDWFPFKGRATAMGVKQTGVNVGGILASLLLPFLLARYPWRLIMGLVGLGALAFALFFYLFYKDFSDHASPPDDKKFRLQGSWSLLKDKTFVIATLSGLLLMIVQFSFSTYWVLYSNQVLHYSIEYSGFFLALSFATGAFARVGWSLGSDYLIQSRKKMLVLIGVLGTFATFFLSFTSPSSPSWVIYLLSISFGLTGMGWNAVWLTLIGELSLRESTGWGIGFSFLMANLGVLLGPPLFGLLVDLFHSYEWSWRFLAFCMILTSFLILWILDDRH
jgi:MFS family permease